MQRVQLDQPARVIGDMQFAGHREKDGVVRRRHVVGSAAGRNDAKGFKGRPIEVLFDARKDDGLGRAGFGCVFAHGGAVCSFRRGRQISRLLVLG